MPTCTAFRALLLQLIAKNRKRRLALIAYSSENNSYCSEWDPDRACVSEQLFLRGGLEQWS